MAYPKTFYSKNNELTFLRNESFPGLIRYESNSTGKDSPSVNITYRPLNKTLEISGINSGKESKRIRGITRKVIEAATEVFDINSIRFCELIETGTINILANSELTSGYIEEIPAFEKSAFLRALHNTGFRQFETEYGLTDYLTGYK